MADRGKGKAGRVARPRPSGPARSAPRVAASGAGKLTESPAAENARLRSELAAAHARIAQLEQQRTDAIHRIDWVVDQLKELLAGR